MRPTLEVADIVRAHGEEFRHEHSVFLSTQQKRVLRSLGSTSPSSFGVTVTGTLEAPAGIVITLESAA